MMQKYFEPLRLYFLKKSNKLLKYFTKSANNKQLNKLLNKINKNIPDYYNMCVHILLTSQVCSIKYMYIYNIIIYRPIYLWYF